MFLKVLLPLTLRAPGALLPACAAESDSFLEPISYFCFNERVSSLAGKLQWARNAIFFFLDPDIMYLEPKSLSMGPDLGFVGPGPRVDMLKGPMCVLSSKVKGPGHVGRAHHELGNDQNCMGFCLSPACVNGFWLPLDLPHFTSIFLPQLPPPVDFKAQRQV